MSPLGFLETFFALDLCLNYVAEILAINNNTVKYIKLVTGAHEDLKAEETEDDVAFLNEIGSRIR
jgi:hypothetical protein